MLCLAFVQSAPGPKLASGNVRLPGFGASLGDSTAGFHDDTRDPATSSALCCSGPPARMQHRRTGVKAWLTTSKNPTVLTRQDRWDGTRKQTKPSPGHL